MFFFEDVESSSEVLGALEAKEEDEVVALGGECQ